MQRNEITEMDAGKDWVQPEATRMTALLPILAMVFVAFLMIGLAMPVLPMHVHHDLGLSTFVVGLVAGSQFASSLVTRFWAGHYIDTRGAKNGVIIGLRTAALSGVVYWVSLQFTTRPMLSAAMLIAGRAMLGAAESLTITGALSWGIGLMGAHRTGKVMAWVGTALFSAFAIGAPCGSLLYGAFGFKAIAFATISIPLATMLLAMTIRGIAAGPPHDEGSIADIVRAVWAPGMGLALSGVGFGAVTTFVVLLFAKHGWSPSWLAFTCLSAAFIAGRIFFGHTPDQMGGAKVALVSVLVEAVALILVWRAPSFAVALVGVTLTGLGYSLIYPAFGVEAVHRAPPQRRGMAVGAYSAFLDLSLGISSPLLGFIADRSDIGVVFLAGAVVVSMAGLIALRLLIEDGRNGTRSHR